MKLDRTRRRLRTTRDALTMLFTLSRRDRTVGQLVKKAWLVTRSEGMGGIKTRLISLALALQPPPAPVPYTQWIERFDSLGDAQLTAAKEHLKKLNLPDLLIIAALGRIDLPSLDRMIKSWQSSIHTQWHAALMMPADINGEQLEAIKSRMTAESRISIVRNAGELTAMRTRFDYSLLCFEGVLINAMSSYMLLEAAVRTRASVVYSDNDQMDSKGKRSEPAFKPQFSPEYIKHFNYIGNCFLLSRKVDICDDDAESLFNIDVPTYDRLVARLVARRRTIHVPFLLFHTLDYTPRSPHDLPICEDQGPSVAIIIPTRDGLHYLKACVESIRTQTSYAADLFEIIIVDNNSSKAETLAFLNSVSLEQNVSVIPYPHPFNFSAINNFGARHTDRDILIFLNNDTLVNEPGWLSKLVWHAKQPDVGVVGAKLLFPDGTIQHGGCAAGAGLGTVQHLLSHKVADDVASQDHTREMTLMTGACYAIRRSVFERLGGFDPILKITWNDAKLCLDSLNAGFRNVYVSDPLLIHDESKTRGRDTTREHMIRFFGEANYTRRRYRSYFFDDPSYNPNLSAEQSGDLALPPRVRRPWLATSNKSPRILVLSSVYKIGFGVPLVIQQHVRKLVELGYEVIIGGPKAEKEFAFPGCERVELTSVQQAAVCAFENDVALIVSHTPPFFEIPALVGGHIPVLAYDYGEPAAEFFPEPTRSYLLNVEYQKRAAASLTTTIVTISQAVKDETTNKDAFVVGLANSHLPAWSEAQRPRRDQVRQANKWSDRFVILSVCRFSENERIYKGLDKIARIIQEFGYLYPQHSNGLVWALAGAGSDEDVARVESMGFTVFPNVPDDELTGLYTASDVYMGFSRWEGYNLGISQALAMGLPTLASDIPAHREFPISTTNSILVACTWLSEQIASQSSSESFRSATVYDWEVSAANFAELVAKTLGRAGEMPLRSGYALD